MMQNQQSQPANRKSAMRRLFGYWRRVCQKRRIEGTREERLDWAKQTLDRWVCLRCGTRYDRGKLDQLPRGEGDGPTCSVCEEAGQEDMLTMLALQSWKELKLSEIGFLVHELRRELGSEPGRAERRSALRLRYLLWLAPRVYGSDWDSLLHARLEGRPYSYYGSVDQLDGQRAHGLMEEMLDELARKRAMENGNSKMENRDQFPVSSFQFQLSSAELRLGKQAIRREMIAAVRGKVKG
jgi:hypothetical protein